MNSWLIWLWRWIYRLQTRVMYFLFTSFWVKLMIEAKEQDFRLFGMHKFPIFALGSLMILMESFLSLAFETQLCYFLPTKNFLSSKNYNLQLTTFFQKLIIQLLVICVKSDSEALAWIVSIIGMIMGMIRFYELFRKLTLYQTKALFLQASLLSMVISASFAHFMNLVLKKSDYERTTGINFVIITWVLLALLMGKMSFEALKSLILSTLVGHPDNDRFMTPEMLIHKVIFAKDLEKNEIIPTLKTSNCQFQYLVLLQHNLNLQQDFGESETLSEEMKNKIYLQYSQELLKKYPENFLIKLHLAYRSFKNSGEPIAKIIKMVNEIQGREWSNKYLSSSLLLKEIEESILKAGNDESQKTFDLFKYVKSRILIENIQNKMLKQAELQIKVCNNILKDVSDIGQIHNSAQKISKLKAMIKKETEKLSKVMPENYISPLLCYAEYFLVLNYSVKDFEKYYEMYTQRHTRVQKFFKEISLMEENLYQGSNAFLLVSSQKSTFGKILYSNNSLMNLCGGSRQSYHNAYITSMFPASLRSHYENLFRKIETSLNHIHRVYLYHKDQYLVEADIFMKYHPYLEKGLCLNMIIRPVPISDYIEFLLLKEDGEIEGASQKLSKLLDLKSMKSKRNSRIPIKTFSEKLDLANTAFNMILKNMKSSEMSYDRAREICDNFTSGRGEKQEIHFESSEKKFYAQIQVLNYGNIRMKLVILKAAKTGAGAVQKDDFSIQERLEQQKYYVHTLVASENFDFEDFENSSLNRGQNLFPTLHTRIDEILPTESRNLMRETLPTQRSLKERTSRADLFISDPNLESEVDIDSLKLLYMSDKVGKYLSSNSSSKVSSEKAESKGYKVAIISKSYPKSFNLLCLAFYFVIIMTFVGQLIMKSVSDSTMNNLQIRKNMLKFSEEKLYKGALIQVTTRGITLVLQSLVGVSGDGVFIAFSTSIANLQLRIADMKAANEGMLDYVYKLDKEIQGPMFRPDVRINGTYLDYLDNTTRSVSIFQVVGVFGNALKTLKYLDGNASNYKTSVGHIANYLLRNTADDFLYKSQEVTEILTTSVEEQRASFQFITDTFLVLNPFLLMGIGILLVCIIWNQHRIEREHMKAFIKLPSGRVQSTANRLARFKQDLMNEETFENKWASSTGQSYKSIEKIERGSAYSKNSDTRKIKYNLFRKRYQKYIVRVILCMSFLVVITLVDLITTQKSIKVIYNRQSQLQYANYISNRALVTYLTFVELFFTNNTLKVEHVYPLEGLIEKSKLIKQIKSEIHDKFLEVDGTYNPEVQKIIFQDNPSCAGFNASFVHYCKLAVSYGQPVNMMVTISNLQNLLGLFLNDYLTMNKSNTTEVMLASLKRETPLTYAIILCEEAHRIADIMDKSMMEKISEMKNTKILIIIVFSIGLLVVSALIWLYILKVIREVNNDFKKVLQCLPSNLVLSSYLLKRFLQDSSNGLLK